VSLPGGLCNRTLDRIVERAALVEVTGPDGGHFQSLTSVMGPDPVGSVRIFRGDKVAKAVYVGITVEQIGLDSHMVFAFTAEGDVVPHFTLDSVGAGGYHAFHLDLIQRVDLGTHLDYLDWGYGPLNELFEEVSGREGITKAAIGPRQAAMMSPYMLVGRATEEAFAGLDDAVNAYLDQWFALVEGGIPAEVAQDVSDTDPAHRDARNRALLFSPDVDHVWAQISRLLGDDVAESVRAHLLTNTIPSE